MEKPSGNSRKPHPTSIEEIRRQREKSAYMADDDLKAYEAILGVDFSLLKDKRVLDIGSGKNEKFSKEAHEIGINVISLNPRLLVQDDVSEELKEDWEHKRSVSARAQQMPFEDNSFDCEVALFSVPYYLPLVEKEYKLLFQEVIRTLKPGAKAYFCPILENYHEDETKRSIPKDFITGILNQFSGSITYELEEFSGSDEARLILTKNP